MPDIVLGLGNMSVNKIEKKSLHLWILDSRPGVSNELQPVSVNEILLGYSHIHLFAYCLRLL